MSCSDETCTNNDCAEEAKAIPGRIFLFVTYPDETIEAGYTEMFVERSKDGGATWKEIAGSVIQLDEDRHNYRFDLAQPHRDRLYRPVLRDPSGDNPDLPQKARVPYDTQFENILTIESLKDIYLDGVDLTNDADTPFPDEMFAHGILSAIDWLEHELDIPLQPQLFDEKYDFYRHEWETFGFLQIKRRPVISVESLKIEFPSTTSFIEFDPAWLRVDRHAGTLHILPGGGSFQQLFIGAGGNFMPLYMGGVDFIPQIIGLKYFAGFELGLKSPSHEFGLPSDIRDLVGKKASYPPLNVAGDLISGAGIASKSIGIDSLSQSVSTTSSATNAGYGARLLTYRREVKDDLPNIKRYYRGGRMVVV